MVVLRKVLIIQLTTTLQSPYMIFYEANLFVQFNWYFKTMYYEWKDASCIFIHHENVTKPED